MPRKPFTEFQREIAFDAYYAMGDNRDVKRIAIGLKEDPNFPDGAPAWKTLTKWSADNNWVQRCKQRDIENSRKVQKKTDREVVKTKADYRTEIGKDLKDLDAIGSRIIKLLADMTPKLLPSIIDGEQTAPAIEIKSIEDFDKAVAMLKKYRDIKKDLVKLDLELIGETPDQNQEITLITNVRRPEDWDGSGN